MPQFRVKYTCLLAVHTQKKHLLTEEQTGKSQLNTCLLIEQQRKQSTHTRLIHRKNLIKTHLLTEGTNQIQSKPSIKWSVNIKLTDKIKILR